MGLSIFKAVVSLFLFWLKINEYDRKTQNIIKVKGKDYNISHRFGYIAGLK